MFREEKLIRPEPSYLIMSMILRGFGLDIEKTNHFLFHYPKRKRKNPPPKDISEQTDSIKTKILLFGDNKVDLKIIGFV